MANTQKQSLTIAQVKELAAALLAFAERSERLGIDQEDFAVLTESGPVVAFYEDDKNAFFYLEVAAQ